jgi:hypothetical protein
VLTWINETESATCYLWAPWQEGYPMPEDLMVARARARKLVGEKVWNHLSEDAKDNAIDDEFLTLDAERAVAADPVTVP